MHNFKLVPYQPKIDLYEYSFLPRTIPEWNRTEKLSNLTVQNCSNKNLLVDIM